MAIRTTELQVSTVIELDATIDVAAFIETASLVVDDHCTSSGYSTAKLELIERWLTAHFYAVRVGEVETEKAGEVSQTVFGRVGLHFEQTKYGQQAMVLDSAGNLAALHKRVADGKKGTASMTSLGTDYRAERGTY